VLRAGNITDEGLVFNDLVFVPANRVADKQKIRRNDILIAASSGSIDVVGKAARAPNDYEGGFGAFCKVLRPGPNVEPSYFAHYFRTPEYRRRVSALAAGANINNLRNEHLDEMSIPLPSLPEQLRIAGILDKADALRAKRRTTLCQLDNLTQSIFLDMFGDPATNPKGWPMATLGDETEMVTGYPFRSEEYVTNGDSVRLCRGANILPGRIDWSDLALWPQSRITGLDKFKLQAGDVLIAMDRPWISEGFKIARVQPADCPALLVQRVARLRGGKNTPNEFLFHLLNQPAFTRHCRPTETTVPHISPKDIRSFTFPIPPSASQLKFAHRVSSLEKLKAAQSASLAVLNAQFLSLQHRAFRGAL
jgi:type I restriction enzyme S subunit